ncbi:permease prefix domain 1-containing protein [uncultured Microbacterium sp.]|uniref:permease prefix domain 1-containing protein n=1 Tax=uncultured Microbacterium sp. TaxID=191216 RepID=UPI0028D190BF|nr:permease prefix domain 1-containing protein [uncultured Microbacterium sp.]
MDTTTLTDRYVTAAMRTVPEKQRDDLGAELRASIADQVDGRMENGEHHAAAERAVLTELGDPDKLAAGYTDRPLHLIGPKYYLEWWRLLKLLLWIVLPAAAFGIALAETLEGQPIGSIIGGVVVTLISVAVHLCFWTTLVFVIVERTGARAGSFTEWSVDQLPEPRQRGVGFADLIVSLVFLALAAGAVIWDLTIGFVPASVSGAGEPLPFLNPALWPWWIAGLFVLMALEATLAVVVYLIGRWTPALAVANAVLALAFAVPALLLLSQGQLLNPQFFPTVVGAGGAEVAAIVNVVFGFGIVLIAVWDIIDVVLKTVRSRR